MKKEELKALGLTDEQITDVFKIHGLDIEKNKADLTTKETEVTALKEQLKTANKQIEDFKGLDIESIKTQAEDYKKKFEEAEAKSKSELEEIQFAHEVENIIKDSKARNVVVVKALLDLPALKESKNRTKDLKDAVESLKTGSESYLFDDGEATEGTTEKPNFTRPAGKGKATKMTKEEFNKMTYKERVAMFENSPELYQELTK